jgi:magnesium-transporting ATPase (P-type)
MYWSFSCSRRSNFHNPVASDRESALPYEAIAILAVVLLNAAMGYIQESRAESAVAALRQMSAAHATVLRWKAACSGSRDCAGRHHHREEGDTIPADARLIFPAVQIASSTDWRKPAGFERHCSCRRRRRSR